MKVLIASTPATGHLNPLIAIATFLITVLYAVMRAAPNRWWLVFWLLSQPILVFLLFLQPLVIAPLFFKFRPLREAAPDLVCDMERIVEVARVKITSDRMFVMKASDKLKSVNAYVAGIGASKRSRKRARSGPDGHALGSGPSDGS